MYNDGHRKLQDRFDSRRIADRLEHLDALTKGRLAYTETAGLRQVYKHADMEPKELLEEHYAQTGEFHALEVMA